MSAFAFAPQVEQLGDRVVPSAVIGEVVSLDFTQPGEERGLNFTLARETDPPEPDKERLGDPPCEVDPPDPDKLETDPPEPDRTVSTDPPEPDKEFAWGVKVG